MDETIFYVFHGLAGQSRAGDFLIVFLGEYLIYIIIAIFLFVTFLHWRKVGDHVMRFYVLVLFSATVAEGFSIMMKLLFHRERPSLALDIPHILTDSSFAFPSGHTTLLFALATATYFFNKKFAYVIFVAGVLVGLARIAGGVHYPSDILGGAVLGGFIGFFVYKLCIRYFSSFAQIK